MICKLQVPLRSFPDLLLIDFAKNNAILIEVRSIRKELLSAYVFQSLFEVRTKVKERVTDYNEMRPHKALNYLTPKETYNKSIINKNSNFDWTEL